MNILIIGRLSSAFRVWKVRFRWKKDYHFFENFPLKKVFLQDIFQKYFFLIIFLIFLLLWKIGNQREK